jgi:hypothetical protein
MERAGKYSVIPENSSRVGRPVPLIGLDLKLCLRSVTVKTRIGRGTKDRTP